MEILRQHQGPIDAVFVAIGGGGLISGVAATSRPCARRSRSSACRRPTPTRWCARCAPASACRSSDVGLFSDGTAVKLVGEGDLSPDAQAGRRLHRRRHRRRVRRDQGRVRGHAQHPRAGRRAGRGRDQAVRRATQRLKGKTFVAITCGANMNFDRLRFVAERAEVGEEREALFAVTIPEERGSFRRFCELIGPRSVTEFNYRISDAKLAHVFVGLTIARPRGGRRASRRNFERHGFATVDLTDDELAKEHVRHMVGGRSRAGARRAAVPLRVPGAARRADAVPRRDAPGTGTSACSTTATRAPTTAASWSASRCRRATAAPSASSSTRSPIPASTRPTTRSTACSCADRVTSVRLRHPSSCHRHPLADRAHLQPAARAGAARQAAAAQRRPPAASANSSRWRCAWG